jgi:thymidylate synthase (FAD)
VAPLHLDPVWLRDQYETRGLSTYEIGALVGRDPKRIHDKLRDFGIPTRPRGQNLRGADNYVLGGRGNPWLGHRHSDATRERLSKSATKPKPWLRGARNGMSGRTGASNPRYRDGSSPERQRIYASGEWAAIVREVYARDGFRCRRCAAPKRGPRSLHAHHIAPWSEAPALRFDIANMVTLCRGCHEWVHSRENVDGDHLHSKPAFLSSAST